MFLPPFAGPNLKIDRAYRHFDELKDLIVAYQATARRAFVPVPGEEYAWTFQADQPPPELAIVLGDIAHSLRSALDVMVCDIARLRGRGQSDMAFPFAEDEAKWKAKLTESKKKEPWLKLGSDVVDAISDLKPYRQGNIFLRGLHDINNMDKHKIVCPVAALLSVQANPSHHITSYLRKTMDQAGKADEPTPAIMFLGGIPVAFSIGQIWRCGPDDPHPSQEFPLDSARLIPKLPEDLPVNVPFGGMYISELAQHLLDNTTQVVDLFKRQFG